MWQLSTQDSIPGPLRLSAGKFWENVNKWTKRIHFDLYRNMADMAVPIFGKWAESQGRLTLLGTWFPWLQCLLDGQSITKNWETNLWLTADGSRQIWKLLLKWIVAVNLPTAMCSLSISKKDFMGISPSVSYQASPGTLQNSSAMYLSLWLAQWPGREDTEEGVSSMDMPVLVPDSDRCLWQLHKLGTNTISFGASYRRKFYLSFSQCSLDGVR